MLYPPSMGLPEQPARVGFTVWAFHLENGKWVKDPKYCWTTPATYDSRILALEYAKKVNAVEGWCATTNAPESTRQAVNEAATYHGPLDQSRVGSTASNQIGTTRRGYPIYRESGGGWTIRRPHMSISSEIDPILLMQQQQLP